MLSQMPIPIPILILILIPSPISISIRLSTGMGVVVKTVVRERARGKRARAVPTTVPLREVATFGVHVVPARAMRGSVAVVGELGQDEEEEEGKRERGRETGWGDFSKGPETPEGRETLKVGKVSRRETGDCHTTFTCAGTPDSTRWGGADTIGGGGGGGESRCRLCGEVGRESRGELCDECEYPPRPFMTKKTRR